MSLSLRQLLNPHGIRGHVYKMSTQSNNSVISSWFKNYNSSSDGTEVAEAKPQNILEDKTIFPEFKSGPLKVYREKSSFCYKRMNVILEGEEHIRLKVSRFV